MNTNLTPEDAAALRAPFPAALIGKKPVGGTRLDYVGHAAVTDRLLQVDPLWYWEPMSVDEYGAPRFDDNAGLWIRLTIKGHTRIGYGSGDNASGRKDAANLVKEAISDALRNAAMRFGVALDLWSKEGLINGDIPEPTIVTSSPMMTEKEANQQREKALNLHRKGDYKALQALYKLVDASKALNVSVENENGDNEPLGKLIIRLGMDCKPAETIQSALPDEAAGDA
jgi:hypothetical protein